MATARKKDTEPELGTFEGRDVSAVKIIITKTGDGLSAAMAVEPTILHQGDVGYIVLSFVARKIRFDDDKDDADLTTRIQILEATGATFVDRDLIGDAVEVMQERIEAHAEQLKIERDEAKGIFRLHAEDDDEDEALLDKAERAYAYLREHRLHGREEPSAEYKAAREEFLDALGQLREALPRRVIAERLGLTKSALTWWARQGGFERQKSGRPRT